MGSVFFTSTNFGQACTKSPEEASFCASLNSAVAAASSALPSPRAGTAAVKIAAATAARPAQRNPFVIVVVIGHLTACTWWRAASRPAPSAARPPAALP